MDTLNLFIVIISAALIHASFQLSVSVLTLLGGHMIGSKKSRIKMTHLITSFILGTVTMTTLMLSFIIMLNIKLFRENTPDYVWSIACGSMIAVAFMVLIFYYRRGKGTMLWIPRSFAKFLGERIKTVKSGAETFSLGLTSVFIELLFIIAPLLIASLAINSLPDNLSIIGAFTYILVSSSSLTTVLYTINTGKSLSRLQKWREKNKYFLQFSAGAGLIALALFVYVNQIISHIAIGV